MWLFEIPPSETNLVIWGGEKTCREFLDAVGEDYYEYCIFGHRKTDICPTLAVFVISEN